MYIINNGLLLFSLGSNQIGGCINLINPWAVVISIKKCMNFYFTSTTLYIKLQLP